MKKIALVLFLLFCMCVPAYADNLVELFTGTKNIIYVDVDSIELRKDKNNEYVQVRTLWFPKGEQIEELFESYKKEVGYQVMIWALNTKARQWQSLSVIAFDTKNNMFDDDTRPFKVSQYDDVIPSSYSQYIYEPVMDYYNKTKK